MASLNLALSNFWLARKRNRVLYGGRASSKTWDAAGFLIYLSQAYTIRVVCTRQFQNRIADSVYQVLQIQAERFGLKDQFEFQDNTIIHKRTRSQFMFYGLARNIGDIKGLEGVDIFWHEECHLLTEIQWKILELTLRKDYGFHLFVFNPQFTSDFIWQRFVINPPADTIIRHINYDENPYLGADARKVIEDAKAEDYDSYAHIYLGQPLTDDARVVIKLSWIEAAIDAHVKLGFAPAGRKVIGFDVADDGADLNANVYAHGSVALWCEEWKGQEDELPKSASRTYQNAVARGARVRYDSIGVGAGVGGKLDELNQANSGQRIRYSKFNAGAAVHEPEGFYVRDRMDNVRNQDYFSNLKAQSWWLVADRFRNTYDAIHNGKTYQAHELISISSAMPNLLKLKTELSTPRRDFDANGRVKVESKADLAKPNRVGGPQKSPNLADGFIMVFAPETTAELNIDKAAWANVLGKL